MSTNQPRTIFKNTMALGLSDLITKIGNFVLVFFVARMLHASGLGIYSAAVEFYAIIAVASQMGMTDFLVREIAKNLSKTNRYVFHLSVMVTMASATLTALAFLIVPRLGYSEELALSVYVIILAVIPGGLNVVQKAIFVAHQRMEFVTFTRLVTTIINVVISLTLLMRGYGIVSLVVAFVVIEYINMLLYFFFINRYVITLHWEFDPAFAWSLLGELKVFAVLSLLSGLFARPEIILLSIIQGETQVGYYSAALKIVGLWEIISSIFMTNVFPVLSRTYQSADEKAQLIQDKSVKYLLALSLPLAMGMSVAAEPIVDLVFGSGFEISIPVLQLLAWSVPLAYISSVLWRVLVARDQQGLVLRVQFVTLVARLASGILLLSLWGAIGAAITLVINLFFNDVLLAIYIKREGLQLNLWRAGGRFAAAALGMGVMTWLLSQYLPLVVLVPIAALVYVLLVLSLKAFSPDDFALFRKIWQP